MGANVSFGDGSRDENDASLEYTPRDPVEGPVGKYFKTISDIVKAGTPSPLRVPSSSRMFGTPVGNTVFSLPASKSPTSLVMTTPSRKKVVAPCKSDTPALGRHSGIGVHPSTPHKGGVETSSSSHRRLIPRGLRDSDLIHEELTVVPGVR